MRNWFKIASIAIIFLLSSCNKEPSLQKYYVNHMNDEEFLSVDVSTNMLFSRLNDVSDETKKSLGTIKKANILAYPINGENDFRYKREKDKVLKLLDKDDYELLARFTSSKGNVEIRYLGTPESIKEIVAMVYSDQKGFALVRLLGKDMNPTSISRIIKAQKKGDLEMDLNAFKDVFKSME